MIATPYAPTRKPFLATYATPLTIAVFMVVGVTGALAFFHIGDKYLKEAHEWLGMAFVAVAALHVARHWKAFLNLVGQRRTWAATALSALALGGFVFAATLGAGHGNPMVAMVGATSKAPLESLAPVMGVSSQILMDRLKAGGVEVADARQSLEYIAADQGKHLPHLYELILKPTIK